MSTTTGLEPGSHHVFMLKKEPQMLDQSKVDNNAGETQRVFFSADLPLDEGVSGSVAGLGELRESHSEVPSHHRQSRSLDTSGELQQIASRYR